MPQIQQIANSKSATIPHFDSFMASLSARSSLPPTHTDLSSTKRVQLLHPLELRRCRSKCRALLIRMFRLVRILSPCADYGAVPSRLASKQRTAASYTGFLRSFRLSSNFFAPLTSRSRASNRKCSPSSPAPLSSPSSFCLSSTHQGSLEEEELLKREVKVISSHSLPSFTEHLTTPFFS